VASIPRLAAVWHPDIPDPLGRVAESSHKKFEWLCPEGHSPYEANLQPQELFRFG